MKTPKTYESIDVNKERVKKLVRRLNFNDSE